MLETTVPDQVTICVLLYGDHFTLAQRVIESIQKFCPRNQYRLVVGANTICDETKSYVVGLAENGWIDRLVLSEVNLNKNPMMRRMFEGIETELIWWFDDDSYIIEPDAFSSWLAAARSSPSHTVMWGRAAICYQPSAFTYLESVEDFIRSADWYRGLPPPSWRVGGKGEFDFEGRGTGDGRWIFLVGGCNMIRTRTVRELDWPDRRLGKMGEDVLLGEAIRQNGWHIAHHDRGVKINDEPRRGHIG